MKLFEIFFSFTFAGFFRDDTITRREGNLPFEADNRGKVPERSAKVKWQPRINTPKLVYSRNRKYLYIFLSLRFEPTVMSIPARFQ